MTLTGIITSGGATLVHQYIIIGMVGILGLIFTVFIICAMRALKKKSATLKLIQQQHAAKIDIIRKDHEVTLEGIRVEMLKREEERTRQWIESEKEALHILNGVSMLLDLNDRIEKSDSEKILLKLDEIREKIQKITPQD